MRRHVIPTRRKYTGEMKIKNSYCDHIQAVDEWLEKNVRVYATPSCITICQIQLDSDTLEGKALLLLGDSTPGEELTLSLGDNGWLTFASPQFIRHWERRPLTAQLNFLAKHIRQSPKLSRAYFHVCFHMASIPRQKHGYAPPEAAGGSRTCFGDHAWAKDQGTKV